MTKGGFDMEHDFGRGDIPTDRDLHGAADHAGVGGSPTTGVNRGDSTTVATVNQTDANDTGPAGTSARVTLTPATVGLCPTVAQKATQVPRVIGLDLSLTCTGVAGEGWTDIIRPKAGLRGHPRLAFIVGQVATHIRNADLVVIEGPSFGGGVAHRHEDLAGLRVMVRHACWRRGIPYAVVPPSCRALYATGKGSGSKGAVRDAVRERYGVECDGPGRYDQADAYTLLAMGLHHLGWPLAVLPDSHRRGLDGCQWPDMEGLAA